MARRFRFVALSGAALVLVVTMACGDKNPVGPTPPPSTCTYTVSPATAQADAAGQSLTVRVDTAPSCNWTARTGAGWATVSPASGSGPADVVVTIAANDAFAERTVTVTIADKDVSVRQRAKAAPAPVCSYALESGSSTFGAEGGRGRVAVKTETGCAWTARSESPWITLRVTSGKGPGEIEYDVASYDGIDQRSTAIVVEQASFPVRQDPPSPASCSYSVDPTSTTLHWHGATGDGFETRLTTSARCSWTAAAGASWIELLTPASGTGSAAMRLRIASYTEQQTRRAPLEIRWPASSAGQNVWITQEGCYYAIGATTDTVPAAGGRRQVSVFGTPVSTDCSIGCPWTVTSNASWILVSGSGSRAGDDVLFFDVAVNTTGAPRTGTLTIAGRTLTVTQGS